MLLIFDCDGTLVDSELTALEVLSERMAELGRPMTVAACLEAFMGRHNQDILHEMERLVGRPLPVDEGPSMRSRILARNHRLQPVRGVAALLAALEGPRCVASSSDLPWIGHALEITGLAPYFGSRLFSASQVQHGKPAPDLFLFAADAMGFAPDDCVVIEDSAAGVEAGVRAGMAVIGFIGASHADPGHRARLEAAGAPVVVDAMADVPEAVEVVRAGRGPCRTDRRVAARAC